MNKLQSLTQALLCFGVAWLIYDRIKIDQWQKEKEKVIICACGQIGQWNKDAHKCNSYVA